MNIRSRIMETLDQLNLAKTGSCSRQLELCATAAVGCDGVSVILGDAAPSFHKVIIVRCPEAKRKRSTVVVLAVWKAEDHFRALILRCPMATCCWLCSPCCRWSRFSSELTCHHR